MALYGSVPFLMSHAIHPNGQQSHSIGFLWLNAAETWIDVTKTTDAPPMQFQSPSKPASETQIQQSTTTHWISESGIIDFFFLLGPSPKQVYFQYAKLTGTSVMPPQSALGYHQCRWNYMDTADVEQVHNSFEQYQIPVDFIWLDIEHTDDKRYFTWHSGKFEQPAKMIEDVAAKGRKVL